MAKRVRVVLISGKAFTGVEDNGGSSKDMVCFMDVRPDGKEAGPLTPTVSRRRVPMARIDYIDDLPEMTED